MSPKKKDKDMQIKFPAAALFLWANAMAAEMPVRNNPVQCASKWKKKRK